MYAARNAPLPQLAIYRKKRAFACRRSFDWMLETAKSLAFRINGRLE